MSEASIRCAEVIRRAGTAMTLIPYGTQESVAFVGCIQPDGSPQDRFSHSLGMGQEERFVLFVPPGTAAERLMPDDCVVFSGLRFAVLSVSTHWLSGKAVYYKCLLRAESGG